MPLSTLRTDLEEMVGNWRARLPAAWRPHFGGVTLPFAQLPSLPGGPVWPATIFRAFRDLAPDRVRAVIFGNDPYTKVAQATGRSFEQGDVVDWRSQLRTKVVSPSLRNIVIAAVRTRPAYATTSTLGVVEAIAAGAVTLPADLFGFWASQGVLWLNRTLTFSLWRSDVRAAHKRLWAPFTARVLQLLTDEARARPLAFVLWGGIAQQLAAPIASAGAARAKIVKAAHPQLSAAFFKGGLNPLRDINAALGAPVKWL